MESRITKEIDSYDTIYHPEKSTFKKIKKIAALSDIHGQYDIAIKLLKNNKIIDKNLESNNNKQAKNPAQAGFFI